jgi:hypothetical protein
VSTSTCLSHPCKQLADLLVIHNSIYQLLYELAIDRIINTVARSGVPDILLVNHLNGFSIWEWFQFGVSFCIIGINMAQGPIHRVNDILETIMYEKIGGLYRDLLRTFAFLC